MKNRSKIILLLSLLTVAFASVAQNSLDGLKHLFTPAKNYVIYHTTSSIIIDGQANETDWENAEWTNYFEDIEGGLKPKPLYDTRVKMLWDNDNLYIFAELEEPHIWAYYDKNDMIVYHENDFEVFIDPSRDTHNYYEFEVNAQNTLFDLFMNKPYRNGGKANIPWNAKGFKSAVYIDGTLNNPTDIDNKWTIEIKIPFASLTTNGDYIQPINGDVWKINFSRVQWKTEVKNGKYVKTINPETNKPYSEDNWVWSPQGVINMHYPERWSMVQFSANQPGSEKELFTLPEEEKWARYLWLIYYKQKQNKRENGIYSSQLSELGIANVGFENDITYQITLETNPNKFSAKLKTESGIIISINEEGLYQVVEH